jgi:hypothetical protein
MTARSWRIRREELKPIGLQGAVSANGPLLHIQLSGARIAVAGVVAS